MELEEGPVFVFESPQPVRVTVYPHLEWARESIESLDLIGDGQEPAFTAAGRVVRVEPSRGLFATVKPTEQFALEQLQALLRQVRGPAHLADDPQTYAQEWMRADDLDARRPPFVPKRVWTWSRTKVHRA